MRKNLLRTIKALRNIPCTLIIVGILKQEHIEQLKKNHIQYKNYLDIPFQNIIRLYTLIFILSLSPECSNLSIAKKRAQRAKLETGMLHPKLRSRNITSREGRMRSESWQSRESGRPYRTSPTGLVLVFLQKQGRVNIKRRRRYANKRLVL